MSKTKSEASSAAAAMQTIASDGYLAFIEWPVFLTNRLKQVEQHLTVTAGHDTPAQAAAPTLPMQAAADGLSTQSQPSLPTAPASPAASVPSLAAVLADQGATTPAATDGAEGDLLRLLDAFTMQGEEE